METFVAHELVGRADEIEQICESIRTGSGAWIVGDSGLGKSALAHGIVSSLGEQVRPYRVHASATLSRIPYGALAPLLTQLTAAEADSPMAVTRTLLARLRSGGESGHAAPALLVVDDAHELDEASADLIVQLVASMHVRTLILSRPGRAAGSAVLDAAIDGLLLRHSLSSLTEDEVHQLCQHAVGGQVLASTSAVLAHASGGNPMFVLALISHARRSGQLINSNNVWVLKDDLLAPDIRLTELVKDHIAGLSAAEREVLEITALAEPIPSAVLMQIDSHDAVETLADAQLISVYEPSPTAEPLVRLRHPLYGDVLRAMVPAGRSRRLRRKIVELMPAEAQSVHALLRQVGWSLDCGIMLSEQRLLWAAAVANNLSDSTFALRAAGAVRSPELFPAARVQMARAHYHRGDYQRSHEILQDLAETASDLETVRLASLLSIQLQVHGNEPDPQFKSDFYDWSAAVNRAAKEQDSEASAQLIAGARRYGELLSMHRTLAGGHYEGAADRLENLLADAEGAADEDGIVLALSLLGEVYASTGRAESAVKRTARALAVLGPVPQRAWTYYPHVLVRHILALMRAGRWDEIIPVVDHYAEAAPGGLVYFGGAVDFARAIVHMCQGKYTEALEALVGAIEGLRIHDVENLRPMAIGLGAFAAALVDDEVLAEKYVTEFEQIKNHPSPQFKLIGQSHILAARILLGSDHQAMPQLQEQADLAQSEGWVSSELELRFLAVRMGNGSRIDRLREVAESAEGGEAAALAAFARGVLAKDPEALMRVGEAAHAAGYASLGFQSLQEASRLAKSLGHRQAQTRVKRLMGDWHGPLQPEKDVLQTSKLTSREREIALLVLDAKRNADIADALSVSVRTVEGHVYRIFEKLGINRREELSPEHVAGGRRS